MFARTARLTLRPGWPEDAPALTAAIAHEQVVRMTSRVPWPYGLSDAEAFLAHPADPHHPVCLITAHPAPGESPELVGGVGLYDADGAHDLGYWLTPRAWGKGYATEAARAMLAHARHGLALARVQAGHFSDNPASGRVLRKLGFLPTGEMAYPSLARGGAAPTQRYEVSLTQPTMLVAV